MDTILKIIEVIGKCSELLNITELHTYIGGYHLNINELLPTKRISPKHLLKRLLKLHTYIGGITYSSLFFDEMRKE